MSSWDKNSNDSILRTLGSSPPLSPPTPRPSTTKGASLAEALTEHGGTFLFAYSPAAKALTAWSDNAASVLGVRDVAITRDGNLFLRHVHPDDRFTIFNELERALGGESDYRATYRWVRPDTNEVRWLHCRAGLIHRPSESLFEGFIIDLSSEINGSFGGAYGPDALPTVLSGLTATVITLDRDGRIVRMHNPVGEPFPSDFGDPHFRSDLLTAGRAFLDGFADEERRRAYHDILEQIFSGSAPKHGARTARNGVVTAIEITPLVEQEAIVGALVLISDVTSVAALEHRVSELQLAEGLRSLATGVVHNFNNALQRIIGQAVLLRDQANDRALVERIGQAIIEIAGRTGDLTRHLFAFEEERRPEPVRIDINVVTMAAVNRIKDLFSTGLKVAVAFGGVGAVLGHHEPLVAILERAIRAMRDRTPRDGSFTVKTIDESPQPHSPNTHGTVKIVVSETPGPTGGPIGPPIAPAVIEEIATALLPFAGTVSFDADEIGRPRLTITLPLAGRSHEATVAATRPPQTEEAEPGILIVDDDTMVLETIKAVLADLGFQTLTAADSTAALEIVKQHGGSLRLVLLDALMPGMDGATLLRRITRRAPHIKVLGFSGAPQHVTDTLLAAGALSIIRKPVDPRTLKDAVEGVMTGREAA